MLYAIMALPIFLVSSTAPAAVDIRTRVAGAPPAVQDFIARRADCNHFTGEEPYDKARAAELDKAIRELRCSRINRDEARLRAKFKRSTALLDLLDATAEELGW